MDGPACYYAPPDDKEEILQERIDAWYDKHADNYVVKLVRRVGDVDRVVNEFVAYDDDVGYNIADALKDEMERDLGIES